MLKGIPVQLKRLVVTVDREHFEFNPTNCSPMKIEGTLYGSQSGRAEVSSPFKVENCASLPFSPKLTASVTGHGSKVDGTSLDVKVESGGVGSKGVAQSNLAKVDLTFPKALPSRLSTLQKACVAVVFEANPAACDEGSVIGQATVHTPVLRSPLTGPGYLVSHGGAEFPDVEFVLQGEGIKVVLDGKTDIKAGITSSKIESAPDVPFTTFETRSRPDRTRPSPPTCRKTKTSACAKRASRCPRRSSDRAARGSTRHKDRRHRLQRSRTFKETKLDEALKACKKKDGKGKKSKRVACERKARKRYGAKKAARKATTRTASRKKAP